MIPVFRVISQSTISNSMNSPYHFVADLNAETTGSLPIAAPISNIPGRAIYADSRIKVLLLPFWAGQTLAEHHTPHDAIMHVLSGSGQVTLGSDRHEVQAGSWMRMAGGLPHSIHAKTDLLLLLQVLMQDGDVPNNAQSAE